MLYPTLLFVAVFGLGGLVFAQAPKPAGAPEPTPALLETGKAVYTKSCVPCHGIKGAGDGAAAAMLNPKPRSFVGEVFKNGEKPENVYKTISEGLPGTVMVAFGHLPESERWALSYYVLELRRLGHEAPKK